MSEEEQYISQGRGKWSEAGVPKRGWRCIDIEDLGRPNLRCQMCESQTIRYVHHMENDRYDSTLSVGCVCAGNMEVDLVASRKREATMKSRAAKRKRWVDRVWRVSQKGNKYIEADGYRIVVYKKGKGWGVTVAKIGSDAVSHSKRVTKTTESAMLAGFDYVSRKISKNSI